MTHLTSDELIDAVEGLLEAERRAHLESCDWCREQVAQLAATFHEAREVEVPEPSPLFWSHLSARVRAAIEAEPTPGGWRRWVTWPVLAPVAALALVVFALAVSVPRPDDTTPMAENEPPPVAVEATPATDDSWTLVADLVGGIDWDTAVEAGLGVRPGAAERAAMDLTPQEQRELRRLLTEELEKAKSS